MRALSDARRTPFDPARAICSPRTTLRAEQAHVANAGVLACIGCGPAARGKRYSCPENPETPLKEEWLIPFHLVISECISWLNKESDFKFRIYSELSCIRLIQTTH
jgi:hypothetical protein